MRVVGLGSHSAGILRVIKSGTLSSYIRGEFEKTNSSSRVFRYVSILLFPILLPPERSQNI